MYNRKKLYVMVTLITLFVIILGVFIMLINTNKEETVPELTKYSDVRKIPGFKEKVDLSKYDLSAIPNVKDLIETFRFNNETPWPQSLPKDIDPAKIMDKAKNPGLGIRGLHEKGLTGKGVNIGIIDLPIYTTHPEYKDAVAQYKQFGETEIKGSALGSGTLSIVAGKTVGIAPDAKVYYAAVAAEKLDVMYYVNAIDWFIELNQTILKDNQIKLVTVPASLDGADTPFKENVDKWQPAVNKAKANGIIVLDCAPGSKLGSCWIDLDRMDDIKAVKLGYPDNPKKEVSKEYLHIPTGPKTLAEEYKDGIFGYEYIFKGGLTWAPSYAVGVLALGIQSAGETIRGKDILDLLYKTAYIYKQNDMNYKIINPVKFVEEVKAK